MRKFVLLLLFLLSLETLPAQTAIVHYQSGEKTGTDLPFSRAVIVGNTIYVSGNIGVDPATGKLAPGGIAAETRQTLENIKATLEANGSSMDKVVKVTVMLADIDEWEAMNAVYKEYFPENRPARSAFGTAGLALNARLEIECIAVIE